MNKEKFVLRKVLEILTDSQMKVTRGGDGYETGVPNFEITGVRCYNGICYHDVLFEDGTEWCDYPCNWSTCVKWGNTC